MKKIVVFLTACLLLIGTLVGTAAAETTPRVRKKYSDLDYSMGSTKSATVYMGDVLEQLYGYQLTDAEKNLIRYKFDGQNVLYYKRPSIIDPQITYNGETQQLTVILMDDYIYNSRYDYDICWTPSRVVINGKSGKFSPAPDVDANYFRATVEGVAWSSNVLMTVEYTSQFTISADTLNDFVNFAYDTAVSLDGEYAIYQSSLEQYNLKLDEYNENQIEWTRYQAELDAYRDHQYQEALYADYLLYQQYLAEMKVYNQAYADYTDNQKEWATYYENCSKFEQYMKYKEQYPTLYAEYQNEMATVNHHLGLLALMEVKDPVTGFSFIETVLDDRVGQVIAEKKAELSALEGSAVDNVVAATPVLQKFFTTYRSLSTDQERYEFYIKEYSSFVKHLKMLYDGINKLYKNGPIYNTLRKDYPDYVDSLVRMLGLLYVNNCSFNDNMTMNLNYEVDYHGHKKAKDLVDASLRPASDTNKAKPLSAWPKPPQHPSECEVTSLPTRPTQTLPEPTKPPLPEFGVVTSIEEFPTNMQDPGTMEEPTEPSLYVPHPGTPPSLPWDSTYQSLYEAYLRGEIVQRAPFGTAQTVTLTAAANHTATLDEDEHYYYIYFYNSDEAKTYIGYDAVRYGESGAYPEDLPVPTKQPVNEIAYAFDHWVYENGEPADLSMITSDVEVFAAYKIVPRQCTVTWDVGGKLIETLWYYGETPIFTGSTDREPSLQYIYTFAGWDKEITTVKEDVVYTAQYSTVLNRHKVTFVMGDGTLIEKVYDYGKNLGEAVPLQTPVKAPTAQYSYVFKGWKDDRGNLYRTPSEFPTLSGPVTFTAEFEPVLNEYTVTWVVEEQTFRQTYKYGEIPVFGDAPGAVPTKPSTLQHDYVFRDWSSKIGAVVGDVTYVAQFDEVTRQYMITFIVDGKEFVYPHAYGDTPVCKKPPEKTPTVEHEFIFAGWDRELEPVTEETTYVARFDTTPRKHPITFLLGKEEVVLEFEYGTVPVYPSRKPTIADDSRYYYVFTGWDRPFTEVDGQPTTYTAYFDAFPLAPVKDGEDGVLSISPDGKYVLYVDGSIVDISRVMDKAGENGAALLQVHFGKAIVEFPKEQVDAFYNMSGAIYEVRLACVPYEGRISYQLELLDANGFPVQFLMTELILKLPYQGAYSADVYCVGEDGALKKMEAEHIDGHLVFSTMDFATYVLRDKYKITGLSAENGLANAPNEAYEGDIVTFTPNPDEGFHIKSVVVLSNGKELDVKFEDGVYSFVMPKGNVEVVTTFKVVEGGTAAEVLAGVITALLIVSIGIVIAIILQRKKPIKM